MSARRPCLQCSQVIYSGHHPALNACMLMFHCCPQLCFTTWFWGECFLHAIRLNASLERVEVIALCSWTVSHIMLPLQELSATDVSNLLWAAAVIVPDMDSVFSALQPKLSDLPSSAYSQESLAQILEVRCFRRLCKCHLHASCQGGVLLLVSAQYCTL